jgi:tetratricopeptide (TPR) repeat protein
LWADPGLHSLRRSIGFARAYLFWGLALKYFGEPAAAVAPLRHGVTCRPVDFDLQFALGEVLLATEQYQEAGVYLENARKLDPEDQRVSQALDRLRNKKSSR